MSDYFFSLEVLTMTWALRMPQETLGFLPILALCDRISDENNQ